MIKKNELIIIPSLKTRITKEGKFILTKKFLEGIKEYIKYWPGKITVLVDESDKRDDNLDCIDINVSKLKFKLEILPKEKGKLSELISSSSLVLGSESREFCFLGRLCKKLKIPLIYITEYSLKTRKQIINSVTKNFIIRFRRKLWEINTELIFRRALKLSEGVQCNGTPTYESYKKINKNVLLFFDNRINKRMIISNEQIKNRTNYLSKNKSLRLAFSGRLIKMKGADHLIKVAKELNKHHIPFKFYIFGDGDRKKFIEKKVKEERLEKRVFIQGVLDFKRELIPFIKKNIDLFVICHTQGDPSCTYLETMACGVPIVGYDNEAFAGIVKYSKSGWLSPINKPKKIANLIANLDKNRKEIIKHSIRAREFALKHYFEKTFKKRINHMIKVVQKN